MSEEGGESRSVGAFLLGFLTGVLVCVGIGCGFYFVVGRKATMQAEMARMEAEVARMEAVEQRARAGVVMWSRAWELARRGDSPGTASAVRGCAVPTWQGHGRVTVPDDLRSSWKPSGGFFPVHLPPDRASTARMSTCQVP